MRTLLPALLLLTTACATTNAQVPHVDRAEAIELVQVDLQTLVEYPTDVHWQRAYRHFDRYLEPHLNREQRLVFEVRFGTLRTQVGPSGSQVELQRGVDELIERLQPQD